MGYGFLHSIICILTHCPHFTRAIFHICRVFRTILACFSRVECPRSICAREQVLESFSELILRAESRSTTNVLLTNRIVTLMIDRHAEVMRIPRRLSGELIEQLQTLSHCKVCSAHFDYVHVLRAQISSKYGCMPLVPVLLCK